jgi:hypothetical protein
MIGYAQFLTVLYHENICYYREIMITFQAKYQYIHISGEILGAICLTITAESPSP